MKNKNSDTKSSRPVEITENKQKNSTDKNMTNTKNTSSQNSTKDCGKNCGK